MVAEEAFLILWRPLLLPEALYPHPQAFSMLLRVHRPPLLVLLRFLWTSSVVVVTAAAATSSAQTPSVGASLAAPQKEMEKSEITRRRMSESKDKKKRDSSSPAKQMHGMVMLSAPPAGDECASLSDFDAPVGHARLSLGGAAAGGAASAFAALIASACLDGSWNLNEEFVKLFKQTTASAVGSVPADVQAKAAKWSVASLTAVGGKLSLAGGAKAVATLLAIWLLRTAFVDRQPEWMMIEAKAKGTLRGTLGVPVAEIDTTINNILQAAQ